MTKITESEMEQAVLDIFRDALLPKSMNGEIEV